MKGILVPLLLLFAIFLSAGCPAPQAVKADIVNPTELQKGEEFEFKVVVENADSQPHQLRSIDVSKAFLQGVYVMKTSPETTEQYFAFGDHIFQFDKALPPNSKTTVVFNSKAVKAGDFSDDLDICIDGDASCFSETIRIIVE